MRYVWGIVFIALGVLMVKYSYQLTQAFGRIPTAERIFSSGLGGTYFFWKLLGIVVVVIALFSMFGGASVLVGPVSGIFGSAK
ncbi:MAG: hypothetical protein ACM3KM_00225 [Acidobacteriaceae bacterium]